MKFLVDLPGHYAEGYKILAEKFGYKTRQALVKFILMESLNKYPEILKTAVVEAEVKDRVREEKKPWNPPLNPPSQDDLEDIFGEDLDNLFAGKFE